MEVIFRLYKNIKPSAEYSIQNIFKLYRDNLTTCY